MTRRGPGARAWLRRAGALILLLLGVALGGGYLALRTSLPQTEGAVALPGLGAGVEVLRDEFGVPHIFAASSADAHFALGFVHAQDRLWQMEARRRLGAGRLAELLGPAALNVDRLFRTLGLYRAAERGFAVLDAETRGAITAYAAGVNAFLETRSGVLPPEFLILGAPEPEPWRPADSLVVLKLMAWQLSRNWRDEILRARLAGRLDDARIGELWPPYPGAGPVALPDFDLSGLAPLGDSPRLAALWEATPPAAPAGVGSNNWVVDGSRSETGKPLLANDVHLALSAPSPFYLAHLSTPGLNVVGATLAGFPAVVLGRNDRIAWGFTNTGPDTQDLFVESVDAGDPGRYRAPDGLRPFEVRDEIIKQAGGDPIVLRVRESRHGPILSDLLGDPGSVLDERQVLAFAWTALRGDDLTPQAAVKLERARDWAGFTAAARYFHGPQQNIVYADVDGNIGLYAPARIPIRRSGDGRAPVPGWSGDYDWTGFVPFAALPQSRNPASGRIVTANNKIVPDDYPYLLTRDWAPPYRARRIAELIDRRPLHSTASFRDIQADQVSLMAREALPHLLAAEPATGLARTARDMLAGWDGDMARDGPEALIFSAWYRALTRLVYADELGPLFDAAWGLRPLFMASVLGGEAAHWCDDVTTPRAETCAGVAGAALDAAAAWLAGRHGDDPADWRWGEAHYANHAHGTFRARPPLGALFGVRIANGGDHFTINAAGYAFRDPDRPFVQTHGPAFRAIYDLADLERSLFVYGPGQSGNPLSPHYRDLAGRWRDHRPFAIPTGRDALEAAGAARLLLVPR